MVAEPIKPFVLVLAPLGDMSLKVSLVTRYVIESGMRTARSPLAVSVFPSLSQTPMPHRGIPQLVCHKPVGKLVAVTFICYSSVM